MAKEIMTQWREGLVEALDAMGIDHRNVRRLVIEVGPGAFPVMHVEMIADPRIIDVATVLVASPDVRLATVGEVAAEALKDVDLLGAIESARDVVAQGNAALRERSRLIVEAMAARPAIPRERLARAAGVTEGRLHQIVDNAR